MKFILARGTTSISVGGREYGGCDGIVDIPTDHAVDLARHDCLPCSVAVPPAVAAPPAVAVPPVVAVPPAAAGGRGRKAKG